VLVLRRFRSERVERLAEVLAEVPLAAIDVVEVSDPQYLAVRDLVRRVGPPAAALVVANALVSYRLSMPGEEYWQEFSKFFSMQGPPSSVDELLEMFARFFSVSRGNRMLHKQKLARLRRAAPVLARLLAQPKRYRDLRLLVEELRAALGSRGDEKTIVFAAKMLHYLHRALGVEEKGLDEVPVPIDRRMALLTYTSGLLDAEPERIMSQMRRDAVEAWMQVARRAGIPSVSLDAIVWLPAYRLERHLQLGLDHARDEYARRLVEYTRGLVKWGLARRLAEEVLHRPPPRQAGRR
jgi:DNA-(apurinic or apyrimidinic site) lyase